MGAMRSMLALLALAAAGPAFAEGPPFGSREELQGQVREILLAHSCRECHLGYLKTSQPKALKVFDLVKEDWPATMIVRTRWLSRSPFVPAPLSFEPAISGRSIASGSGLINTYFFREVSVLSARRYGEGATAIIIRTSSASEPASIFCMTCAR